MPLPLQAKLLRVLEDGEVYPIGAAQPSRINPLIIAATNANLEHKIHTNTLRQDLYFRLARFAVEAPPLRTRSGDIEILTRHFLQLYAREMKLPSPPISDAAMAALLLYDYPGNVRELKNLLERAVMECGGQELKPEHLHFFGPVTIQTKTNASSPLPSEQAKSEESLILRYLAVNEPLTNRTCRQLLDSDRNHASYVLKKFVDSGKILCHGQGRWARYSLVPNDGSLRA